MPHRQALLSLGSNIDPKHHINLAIAALQQHFEQVQVSHLYWTDAVGFTGPQFINAAAAIHTAMSVERIASILNAIEVDNGREHLSNRYCDRSLDIDLLTWGDFCGSSLAGELPRKDAHKHGYVLVPLCDLIPDQKHPALGRTYRALLSELPKSQQNLRKVD